MADETPFVRHVPRRGCQEKKEFTSTFLLKQQNPDRQRQDSGERLLSPFGQALGHWHGTGEPRANCVES